jgi:hypothetical protein
MANYNKQFIEVCKHVQIDIAKRLMPLWKYQNS